MGACRILFYGGQVWFWNLFWFSFLVPFAWYNLSLCMIFATFWYFERSGGFLGVLKAFKFRVSSKVLFRFRVSLEVHLTFLIRISDQDFKTYMWVSLGVVMGFS